MNKKLLAIFFAILAAGLYAINIPFSKLLLNNIEPTMMASYLYLGAGIGIGTVFLISIKGIFSGLGSLIVAVCLRERFANIKYFAQALLLGFVAFFVNDIYGYLSWQKMNRRQNKGE